MLLLFVISFWFTAKRNNNNNNASKSNSKLKSSTIPNVSKEIQEIRIDPTKPTHIPDPNPLPESESDALDRAQAILLQHENESPGTGRNRIHIEIGKDHRISYPERSQGSGDGRSGEQASMAVPEVSHLGWGHWYTLRELEVSTNFFAHENVIGEGGYGIVYRGVLQDNTQVAVKNLLNNRYPSSSIWYCLE